MRRPVIYLAGPMAGHPDPQGWRSRVKEKLGDKVRCIDPIHPFDREVKHDPKHLSLLARDHMHTIKSDVLFVNFLGATRPSLGTMAEIAWAWHSHKPIIVVCDDGNPNDYCMTRAAATFWLPTLEDGLDALDLCLADYYPEGRWLHRVDNR